ncbi:MAG: xylanase [Mucilaginibacter sp.]|nr:xylanase [Mucilaginibacter sp.]
MKRNLLIPLAAILLLASCTKGQNKNKLPAENNSVLSTSAVQATATIDASTVQQNIRGFGGANLVAWIGDLTSAQRTTAFSPINGIGLSVVRVRVPNSNADFAAEKPTIDAAKSYGASVIATAWSAPASMKDNGSVIGGKLKTTSYADYAAFLSSYNTAVGGVLAISPANEPNYAVSYESMNMTASEVADFAAAQGTNCGAPIMAPEPFNMSQTYINTYLSNATAKSKTGYVCGHIYGATPAVFNPGKEIWMTEHYTDTGDANDWTSAMGVAKEIHDCMNAGYNMYVWWYIRRSYGPIDESGNITKRGYVMAQFARWVRPGYNKISCTANPTSGVYVTAYKSGSSLVVVIVNQNTAVTYQSFGINGLSVTGFNRFITTSSSNLVASSFTVSGSSFGINLPASSVTTLVSN